MQKLVLIALVVGLCTPAIMAQETAKTGIYGGLQNLRFNAPETSKQDVPQNLRFNAPETSKQDANNLPQAPESTFSSAIPPETGKQYINNLSFNSRDAAGKAAGPVQCPPSCPSFAYNRVEVYGGYSLLNFDLRVFGLITRTPLNLLPRVNLFDFDRHARIHLNGGDVSVTVNFTRYLGAQFDFSAHTRDFRDLDTAFVINRPEFGNLFVVANIPRPSFRVHNFFGGVQVKDNRRDGPRVRPFGHLVLGASRERLRIRTVNLFTDLNHDGVIESFTFTDRIRFERTSFALAVGGGFDIRITDRFSIRPIKFDYLPIFARTPVLILNPPVPPIIIPIPPGTNFILSFADLERDRQTRNNFRVGAGAVFHF